MTVWISGSTRPLAILAMAGALIACNDGNITTGNSPPNATILQPTDGSQHSSTEPLELLGVAGDTGTPIEFLRVTWTADPGGVLYDGSPEDAAGNTRFVWDAPPIGATTISLSVVDPGGLSATSSISVEIVGNTAPTCAITSPTEGGVVGDDVDVLLQAQVGDNESPSEEIEAAWESDLDGSLGAGNADANGVSSVNTTLSPGTHVVRLVVSDPLDASCEDSVTVTVNGRPTVPEIAFDPADPTTLSDLRVALVAESVDPEGSDVTYAYTWTEDGNASAVTGDLVLAAELDKDETWQVSVQATDADGFESEPVVASVVIANSAPSAPQVSIAPAAPTQADDLVCSVDVASTDADGDSVTYTFDWEEGGAPTGLSGATLPWSATDIGDFWTCVATPSDGEDAGEPATATAPVTPGCAALSLVPTNPGEVVVPTDPAIDLTTGSFTLEAWVRMAAVGAGQTTTIASKRGATSGPGWHFGVGGLQTTGVRRPFFMVSDLGTSSVMGSQQVPLSAWSHLAVTFDAGSGLATLWLDGFNVGSGTVPQPTATASDFVIGADANTGGLVWNGHIDDVRVSDVVRYSSTFVPASQLAPDADTVAWWGFEEAAGSAAKDLSGGGHDGALTGGASFDTAESTCSNDQAPTAPVVSVSPDYPLLDDDLFCSLISASVDPEGATVTYAGQWLVDGVPSGQTFSTFPTVLSSSLTSEGEQWTCSVSASDGSQSGPAGTDSVFAGAMPIGQLDVPSPGGSASTSIPFAPPVTGLVRATLDNPDASRDGVFSIDVLGYGATWVFTGYRDWSYLGTTVAGWSTTDVEFNADPTLGTLTFDVSYDPAAGIDNTGPDTLTLVFVYDTQLVTTGATLVMGSSVGPQETTLSQAQIVTGGGERLLLEASTCGFGGGAHGLYADADGVIGNDGIARVDTGFAGNCLIPLQSRPLGAGTWNMTLANEDDFFADNTDPRAVNLYRYTP
ncbi:MAG: LamG domain-containing protein [Deltaproteobacteria bacterium]|nr:LamG domain-containing protein [Deltaproteobacteria bacterium]